MEVQFLLNSYKMLSPTVLVCSVLVVSTGKGGDSAHRHFVCTCVYMEIDGPSALTIWNLFKV